MLTEHDFQRQYMASTNNDQALITKLSVVCLEAVTGHVARQGKKLTDSKARRTVEQVMALLGQNIARAGELYVKADATEAASQRN